MRNIILTIGIPVFDSEIFLKQTIDSILEQINPVNANSIEILFSDNNSTDSTIPIIKKYQKKFPNLISLFVNEINFGSNINFDLVITRGKGKYVWLLGCGEIVKESSIDHLLYLLKEDTFDNVILNFDIYSEKTKKHENSGEMSKSNCIFYNKEDVILTKGFAISHGLSISSNIVLKESWMKVQKMPIFAKNWMHVERILDIMAQSNYLKTLYVHKPCFTLYREKNGWWTQKNNTCNWYMQLVEITSVLTTKGYSTYLQDQMIKKHYRNIFNSIAFWKQENSKLPLFTMILLFKNKISFWLVLLPLLLVPSKIFPQKLMIFTKTILIKLKRNNR